MDKGTAARNLCKARARVEDATQDVIVIGRATEMVEDEAAIEAVEEFEDAKVALGQAADDWESLNDPEVA